MPLGDADRSAAASRTSRASIRSRASRVQSLDVGRDLVVAAPRGVELAADVAEPVDQRGLDVHVDVFALEDERKRPRLDLRPNFRQSPHNLLAFVGGEQTDMGEHLGVRDRAPDVVLEEPTVKGDRFRELFDAAVRSSPNRPPQGLLATPHAPHSHDMRAQVFGTTNRILGRGLTHCQRVRVTDQNKGVRNLFQGFVSDPSVKKGFAARCFVVLARPDCYAS